jgi:N-acetylneuraminic acid mutarotase
MDEPLASQSQPEPHKGGVGATLGILIVIIVLGAGAIYFFLEEQQRFHTPPVQETINV